MAIQELITITKKLNDTLDQVTKNNRQESIQKLNELLADRESILKQLDPSAVKGDPAIQQLLLDEDVIKAKMQEILNNIKNDLKEVSKKRSIGGNYINPYQKLYVNGAFIDQKK